jgi:hypothetical protein
MGDGGAVRYKLRHPSRRSRTIGIGPVEVMVILFALAVR